MRCLTLLRRQIQIDFILCKSNGFPVGEPHAHTTTVYIRFQCGMRRQNVDEQQQKPAPAEKLEIK